MRRMKEGKGMRKSVRKIMLATVMCGMLGISSILTGCSSGIPGIRPGGESAVSENEQSLSMVFGPHRFFPFGSLNMDSVRSMVYDACYTYGDVSTVIVDGDPYVACNYSINEPDKKIDEAKRKQLAKNNTEQIMAEMSAFSARTPEIDTLSGIQLSADTLHSTPAESDKSMLVFDSGLSTSASLLDFSTQNMIDVPVESIVAQLKELHAIPDLTGIDVIWVGLGQTCGEQASLTADYKYKLQNIWKGILEEGGALSVTFDTSPLSSEECDMDLPECSTIPIVVDVLKPTDVINKGEMPEVIKWDENSPLCFKADKAEFVDPAAAAEQLDPVASYLNANPGEDIYVFGMTATITGGSLGIELAQARADACKGLLMQRGIQESRVITVGLGQLANPLRVNDVDGNGAQIEELAQKNRAVFVVKADSDLVDVLIGCREKGEV